MSKRSAYEFRQRRDEDLLRAYRSLLAKARHISLKEVMSDLAKAPASRFWVSEERAVSVVARMFGGGIPPMSQNKLLMFREIARRTQRMMSRSGMSLRQAVARVIEEPAPCFYITPKSAKMLVSRARRRQIMSNEGRGKGNTR